MPVLLLRSGGSFAFSTLSGIYRSTGPSPVNFHLSSKFLPVSETRCPKLGSTIAQGCQNVQSPEGPPGGLGMQGQGLGSCVRTVCLWTVGTKEMKTLSLCGPRFMLLIEVWG